MIIVIHPFANIKSDKKDKGMGYTYYTKYMALFLGYIKNLLELF